MHMRMKTSIYAIRLPNATITKPLHTGGQNLELFIAMFCVPLYRPISYEKSAVGACLLITALVLGSFTP